MTRKPIQCSSCPARLTVIEYRCADALCRGAMCRKCAAADSKCAIGHHGTVTEPAEPNLYATQRAAKNKATR